MRFAVSTQIVVATPGRTSAWEESAGVPDLARIAQAADELGYDYLTCSEHIAVRRESTSRMLGGGPRGTRYWDPLATLSYLSALTKRIRLTTSVLVLGYHHPLALAKRYGTLDLLSGGRLVLGLGVGTAFEEFTLLDVPYGDRGPRADEAIRALRRALSVEVPTFAGDYYSFEGLVVDPHAVQDRVPLWIGGSTPRALRRAVELGDGWLPAAMDPELLRRRLERYPHRQAGFEVAVRTPTPLDPIGDPGGANALIGVMSEAGATIIEVRLVHTSAQHYVDQLDRLAEFPMFEPRPAPGQPQKGPPS